MAKKNDLLGQAVEAKRQLSEMTQKYERLRRAVFTPTEVPFSVLGDLSDHAKGEWQGVFMTAKALGYRCEMRLAGDTVGMVFVANPKEEL